MGKNKFYIIFKEILSWIKTICIAFIVAFLINNYIISNSQIPTASMETTLPVGTRLFGFRLNYLFSKPKRGDVVIFHYGYKCPNCDRMFQKNNNDECYFCRQKLSFIKKIFNKVYYIKRVIGLPGEMIDIKNDYTEYINNKEVKCGHIYINDVLYNEDYLNGPMIVDDIYNRHELPSKSVVVPDNSYFLIGDNRNNSEDARFWPNTFINSN